MPLDFLGIRDIEQCEALKKTNQMHLFGDFKFKLQLVYDRPIFILIVPLDWLVEMGWNMLKPSTSEGQTARSSYHTA